MSTARRTTLLIIVVLLIPIVPFVVVGELPGERWLSAVDDHAFRFGLTGASLLAIDVLLPIPSSIVGTLLGARLGFWGGSGWAWAGLLLGNSVGYAVGRWWLARLAVELPQTPTRILLFLSRPVPVLAEAVTVAAGVGGMAWRSFLPICAVGNGLYALVLAGNGAALLPPALVGPGLLLPMALPVVAWLLWRWRARRLPAVSTQVGEK